MACIINATAPSVSSFRITAPVTQTRNFDGDWEGAIDFTVQTPTVCDEVYLEEWNYGTSTWDYNAALASVDGLSWTCTTTPFCGNPLKFRAQSIIYPSTYATSPEIVITYNVVTVTITDPTDGYTWVRGTNYFAGTATNVSTGYIGVSVDGGPFVSNFGVTAGAWSGFADITTSGTVGLVAYLSQGSFAFSPAYSAVVTGTIT